MLIPILLLILGLALLVIGAEWLVRGAAGLAGRLGVSPLVVGLTIVAFGTSSPEIAVSLQATAAGNGELAIGNAVGSNIFNVLFILGVSALIAPLIVHQKMNRIDVPIMIGASGLLWILCLDGAIGRVDGLLLFAGIVAYTGSAIYLSRRESAAVKAEYAAGEPEARPAARWWILAGLILIGLAACVLGSHWLVRGAVTIAAALGVSDLVIGLTIVAAGTSLPEVATSITAAARGQRDIAVGNVVGSNIFNILAILGLAGVLSPAAIEVPVSVLHFDIPVMTAVALACLPIFFTGGRIVRAEGALLLAAYAAYALYLILAASRHDALEEYTGAMLWFALPLALLGVIASVVTALRKPRSGDA